MVHHFSKLCWIHCFGFEPTQNICWESMAQTFPSWWPGKKSRAGHKLALLLHAPQDLLLAVPVSASPTISLNSTQMGEGSWHTDLGAVLTQTRASTMAPWVFLDDLWVYPTVLRTEHGPHAQWTRTALYTIYPGPAEFLKYTFQTRPPVCFSQGTCLTLLSQAPLGALPSHRSLSTPGSFPFTPVLGQISPPTPGQSEHQKERQCPTAHLISGCTNMNSRKHVHTHTGVRGRKKETCLIEQYQG